MDPEIQSYLDEKAEEYNCTDFIRDDPISVPHQFTKKEDIEIIGFLVATIAWGNRLSILKSGNRLIQELKGAPHDFVMNARDSELKQLQFVHRTFNSTDLKFFIRSLRNIYTKYESLEEVFSHGASMKDRIEHFRNEFFLTLHEKRSEKHVSSPLKGSAAKRINMFLRWMVRRDNKGVDFGIWTAIEPSELYVPLDVHSGVIARELGLLKRKQNDWRAVEELMSNLRALDPDDPCKYDFALFGIGVNKDLSFEKL